MKSIRFGGSGMSKLNAILLAAVLGHSTDRRAPDAGIRQPGHRGGAGACGSAIGGR